MKWISANTSHAGCIALVWLCLSAPAPLAAQQAATKPAAAEAASPAVTAKMFDSPQQAADALVEAAANFDVAALTSIFGPDGNDIVLSGEFSQDRKHAADFAAQASIKKSISVNPKNGTRAF